MPLEENSLLLMFSSFKKKEGGGPSLSQNSMSTYKQFIKLTSYFSVGRSSWITAKSFVSTCSFPDSFSVNRRGL